MVWQVLVCALALVSAPSPEQKVGLRSGTLYASEKREVVGRAIHVSSFPPRAPMTGTRGPFFPGIGTSNAPANCDVAVGPDDIVQVVNGKIAFFSKTGVLNLEQDASAFFAGLAQTPSPQEPRAVYDDLAQRFFLLFVENDDAAQVSNILLAVSDDDDPSGTWYQYRIDGVRVQGAVKYRMERPGLGYDQGGICITGTHIAYDTGIEGGSSFFVIQKPALLSGSAAHVVRILDMTYEFAQVGESIATPSPFLFGATQVATNSFRTYRVKDADTPSPLIEFREVAAQNSLMPPAMVPSTGGANLETNTNRVVSVFWRDGKIVIANNSRSGASMVGVREHIWDTSQFNPGTMQIVSASLVSSASVNYFMPACALNKWGDAGFVFSGSSSSVTSDILCAGRLITDSQPFVSVPTVLASANGGLYLDSRWGGYFGIDVDPVDGETFWGTAMTVSATGWWETHIVPFTVSKTWPVAPAAYNWVRGGWQSGGVASLMFDDGDYNVAKAGLVLFPNEPPAQIVVDSVAPVGQVLGLSVSIVAKVNTPGLSQRVELWNWTTGAYVSVGTTGSTVSDSIQTATASGALAEYVQAGTRAVRAKVSFFRTGLTFVFPWTSSVDQVEWKIRVR